MIKVRYTYDRRGSDCECVSNGSPCEVGFYQTGGWHYPTEVGCPNSDSFVHDASTVDEYHEARVGDVLSDLRDFGAVDHAQLDAPADRKQARLTLYFADNQASCFDSFEEYRAAHLVGDTRLLTALARKMKVQVS